MPAKTTVLGVGNSILSDEGAGVFTIQRLQAHFGTDPSVQLIDAGTLSFTLATAIADCQQLVVVDATQLGQPPGTVESFEGGAMDKFLIHNRRSSVHEVGLLDLLSIARLTDSLPDRRVLVGIQPEKIDWGDEPTPAVDRGIDEACGVIIQLLERWNNEQN